MVGNKKMIVRMVEREENTRSVKMKIGEGQR